MVCLLFTYLYRALQQPSYNPAQVLARYAAGYPTTSSSGSISKIWMGYIPSNYAINVKTTRQNLFVISSINHGQFSPNLAHGVLNRFATRQYKCFLWWRRWRRRRRRWRWPRVWPVSEALLQHVSFCHSQSCWTPGFHARWTLTVLRQNHQVVLWRCTVLQ